MGSLTPARGDVCLSQEAEADDDVEVMVPSTSHISSPYHHGHHHKPHPLFVPLGDPGGVDINGEHTLRILVLRPDRVSGLPLLVTPILPSH